MKTERASKTMVPAIEQASRILIEMSNSSVPWMTLTELSKATGMYKSRVHSILTSLAGFGFVRRDDQTKRYTLGFGLLNLARSVLDNLDFRVFSAPYLEKLTAETECAALLGMISADQVYIVAKKEADGIGVTLRIGHRFHITAGAHGKAIVAFLPAAERKRILSRSRLFFYGGDGRLSQRQKQSLDMELRNARSDGFASDIGNLQAGVTAVSAPLFATSSQLVGCVILMGHFDQALVRPYGELVAQTASTMSKTLGADEAALSGPGELDDHFTPS